MLWGLNKITHTKKSLVRKVQVSGKKKKQNLNSTTLSYFALSLGEKEITLQGTVQFGCSVMSDSLRPHGLQHSRPPYPSPTPGACSNSCPSSWWCHPTISSSVVPFSSYLQFFPSITVFSNELVLHIRRSRYWSFSFNTSPSNEYSGLISFRMDWFDFLAVQGMLKSLLQHHRSKA